MADVIYEIEPTAKYRKMPLVTGGHGLSMDENARVVHCARKSGHILHVHGGEIRCSECPAVWKDEGF